MPTLTLKNVPPELHRRLKAQAARHRRSLNREAIHLLERAVLGAPHGEADEAGRRAAELRAELNAAGVALTDSETRAAVTEGRP